MKKTILSCAMIFAFMACQSNSKSEESGNLTEEEQTVLADSIANEIEESIQVLKEQTEEAKKEIESLLEGI